MWGVKGHCQLNINRHEAEYHCRRYKSRFCIIIDDTWSCRELHVNTKYTVCKDLEYQIVSVIIYIYKLYYILTYFFKHNVTFHRIINWSHWIICSPSFKERVPPSPCAMSGKMVGRSCLEEETEVFNRCYKGHQLRSYPQVHFVYIHENLNEFQWGMAPQSELEHQPPTISSWCVCGRSFTCWRQHVSKSDKVQDGATVVLMDLGQPRNEYTSSL